MCDRKRQASTSDTEGSPTAKHLRQTSVSVPDTEGPSSQTHASQISASTSDTDGSPSPKLSRQTPVYASDTEGPSSQTHAFQISASTSDTEESPLQTHASQIPTSTPDTEGSPSPKHLRQTPASVPDTEEPSSKTHASQILVSASTSDTEGSPSPKPSRQTPASAPHTEEPSSQTHASQISASTSDTDGSPSPKYLLQIPASTSDTELSLQKQSRQSPMPTPDTEGLSPQKHTSREDDKERRIGNGSKSNAGGTAKKKTSALSKDSGEATMFASESILSPTSIACGSEICEPLCEPNVVSMEMSVPIEMQPEAAGNSYLRTSVPSQEPELQSAQPSFTELYPSFESPDQGMSSKSQYVETSYSRENKKKDDTSENKMRESMTLSTREIGTIANKIGKEWYQIAIEMGYSAAQADHLREMHKISLYDRNFCMIIKWMDVIKEVCDNPKRLLAQYISRTGNNVLASEIDTDFQEYLACPVDLDQKVQEIVFTNVKPTVERSVSHHSRNIEEQHRCTLQSWRDLDVYCLETKACKDAMECFDKNGTLTLVGGPGEGKSFISHHIALHYQSANGYTIIPVTNVKEIESSCNPKLKQLFVIDDPLGSHCLEEERLSEWAMKSEKIRSFAKNGLTKIIATIRTAVFQECKSKIKKTIFSSSIIDLTTDERKLTESERKSMLTLHCGTEQPQTTKFEALTNAYYPGFPLLCHLIRVSGKSLDQLGNEHDPFSLMLEQVEEMKDSVKEQYCALVLAAMFDGSFYPEDLDQVTEEENNDEPDTQKIRQILSKCGLKAEAETLDKIQNSFNHLNRVYFIKKDDEFCFLHDVIFSAVAYHFGSSHIQIVLSHCSSKFIQERVRVKSLQKDESCTQNFTKPVEITVRKYLDLAKRLTKDIEKKQYSHVFQNPSIHDAKFQDIWMKHLTKINSEELLKLFSMQPLRETESDPDILKNLKKTLDFAILSSTPFHWLCINGMTKMLKEILSKYNDKNQILNDLPGHTRPLHFASGCGHLELVKYLIDLGQDVNSRSCLEKEDIDETATGEYYTGFTPLFYAARENHIEVVEYLLQKGAEPNLVRDHGASPMLLTSDRGHCEVVRTLIQYGGDPNLCCDHGTSPLILAASENHYETAKVLIENGAHLNIQKIENGVSAVFFASTRGHSETLKLLLENNANPDLCNSKGVSPLATTIEKGFLHSAELLLEYNANVNISDQDGNTPLLHAVRVNFNLFTERREKLYDDLIKGLLDKGADPLAQNKQKQSPRSVAEEKGDSYLLQQFDKAVGETQMT